MGALLANARYRLEKIVHPLQLVVVEITNRCNLSCLHCYACAGSNSSLALAKLQDLAKELHSLRSPLQVSITGGEPLLHPDLLPILDSFRSEKCSVTLTTNGSLITESIARELAARVTGVIISVDGLEGSHNALRQGQCFNATMAGITHLQKAGVTNIVVKTAVCRLNIAELPALGEELASRGISLWHVFPVEPWGRAKQATELFVSSSELSNLQDKLSLLNIRTMFGESGSFQKQLCTQCVAGIKEMAILHNGDVVACINGLRDKIQGNIKKEPLLTIWNHQFKEQRHKCYTQCGAHFKNQA